MTVHLNDRTLLDRHRGNRDDRDMKCKGRRKGFSLVELMIVVVIVGILVAMALPSYKRYIRKANRVEAQQLLMNWANNQEIWRANDFEYAVVPDPDVPDDPGIPVPTLAKYTFTLSGRAALTYILTATATGDQAKDIPCDVLTLNQSNAKEPTECW